MPVLESVNLGHPEPIRTRRGASVIYKRPVAELRLEPAGVAGDAVLDTRHHGGPDQAVYAYLRSDYDWWTTELGQPLPPGTFGENLTVAGLDGAGLAIGDRFRIGDALLEITLHREPCSTLAARMGDPHWPKRFFAANRPGVCARVLHPGRVEAGMPVRHIPYAGEPVRVTELMQDYKNPAPERMRRLLKAPIHRELVEKYEARLAQGDLLA